MKRTIRIVLVAVGVACFVVAATSAAGWFKDPDPFALALTGFACWLASTAP